ncbi:MAG: hypothetical protein JRJ12_04870 [Deltaproteobacteria bacterium]|nr:hypothetical protein [Deltaproteobacteria bacterium]MBW2072152.1 hypothetical protein [Deltaproteobacteria bacterium]
MKKTAIISILILGTFAMAMFAYANDVALKSYYNDCIEKRIARCERMVAMLGSRCDSISRCARINTLQLKFLRENKDKLVQDMFVRDIGMKSYRVEYFLSKKFFEVNPEFAMCTASLPQSLSQRSLPE